MLIKTIGITVILEPTYVTGVHGGKYGEPADHDRANKTYQLTYATLKDISSFYIRGLAEMAQFNGSTTTTVVVPIPDRYVDEIVSYVVFQTATAALFVGSTTPLLTFDFARFLDDDEYIKEAVDNLFRHWSQVRAVVYDLDDLTQHEIFLRSPYDFIPANLKINRKFMNEWGNSNRGVIKLVDSDVYYINFESSVTADSNSYIYTDRLINYHETKYEKEGKLTILWIADAYPIAEVAEYHNGKANGLYDVYRVDNVDTGNDAIRRIITCLDGNRDGVEVSFYVTGRVEEVRNRDLLIDNSRQLSEYFRDDAGNTLDSSPVRPLTTTTDSSSFNLRDSLRALRVRSDINMSALEEAVADAQLHNWFLYQQTLTDDPIL